jgi:phage-related minor tail protein
MTNEKGITATANFAGYLGEILAAVKKSLVDGWQWTDGFNFIGVISDTPTAIKGFGEVISEVKDQITDEEKTIVIQKIIDNPDIPLNDKVVAGKIVDAIINLKQAYDLSKG